jgi:hypothetical protein
MIAEPFLRGNENTLSPKDFPENGERVLKAHPDMFIAPYTSYSVNTIIEHNTGVSSAPVANSERKMSAFWADSGGNGTLTVKWSATRIGAMPILPGWQLPDPMYVLIQRKIHTHEPHLSPDGTNLIYEVLGEYVYDLKAPPNSTFNFPVPASRVFESSANDHTLSSTGNFDNTVLGFLCGQSPPPESNEYGMIGSYL